MKASLERLHDLAPSQDLELATHDLEAARQRFLTSAGRPARPSAVRRLAAPAAALAAAAAILLVVLWPRTDVLTFDVGTADGRVGAWIAASAEEPIPLRFSDGTSLVLQPTARARVVATEIAGARVLLESGVIHASVTHTGASAWSFDAGPFEVHVTGTRFELAWDPTKQELRVALQEGSVVVTGACLPERRPVVAGETLQVFCKEQRSFLTNGTLAGAETSSPSARALPSVLAPPALPGPLAPLASASAAGPSVASRSTWRELMSKNRYQDAMEAAEAEGFDALVARESAADLLALADVARFAGRAARASQALTTLRSRFGGSRESARAAFDLGRLAFDQRGAHGEAARWFSAYLAEQPGGPLAQEALGRLIECRESMGAVAEAREAARRYLAAYPEGPHAARAKSLLASE